MQLRMGEEHRSKCHMETKWVSKGELGTNEDHNWEWVSECELEMDEEHELGV
ncbi:hypothetical protein DEO72_LG7g1812 [Vigna unguiculata]|uniref:Uncharacterized protein n=1 Tax=Vigna unguiculata TaxID=3917 RepID=A0A4D6MIV2_VIGUN|nr:hypothetical protein DEO72_LG7g1812 [Vigna unguiculata]